METAHTLSRGKGNLDNTASNGDEQKLLELAIESHNSGDLDRAVEYYSQVIQLNPANINALQLLSCIAYNLKDFQLAESLMRSAIKLDGKIGDFHKRLGDILSRQGLNAQAKNAYKKALKLLPKGETYEVYNNLGLLYHKEENFKKAVEQFKKSVYIKPDFATAWNNYGNTYVSLQQYSKAINHYETCIRLDGDFAEPRYNLANMYYHQQDLPKASELYRKALQLNPTHSDAMNNLGCVLRDQSQNEEAIQYFTGAIAINPDHIDALCNAASLSADIGNLEKSLMYLTKALEIDAGHIHTLKLFSELVRYLDFESYQAHIDQAIQNCYQLESINHQLLSRASSKLARLHYAAGSAFLQDKQTVGRLIETLAKDILFQKFMLHTVNEDIEMELLIKLLRKELSARFYTRKTLFENEHALALLIAIQMHNNEYVIDVTSEEDNLMQALLVEEYNYKESENKLVKVIVASMYQAPRVFVDMEAFGKLMEGKDNYILNEFFQRTLVNPLLEQEYRKMIPNLIYTQEEVSKKVRNQYEENPYPRWLSLTIPDENLIDRSINISKFLNENANMLIAGCGTGMHPIMRALQYPNANITAIDLSLNSLAYAKRMSVRYQCNNITFMQADIMDLHELKMSYDLIESIGVLHHLHDPVKGWISLLNHLQPNGIMKIGLYSKLARNMVIKARECIAAKAISAEVENIRRFRQEIINNPENTVLFSLTEILDFFSLSGCRDLIFHSQEHCFTLSQIQELLSTLSLELIGFDIDEAGTKVQYLDLYPDDPNCCNLENWEVYEQKYPGTFKRMYQFYVKSN